MTHWGRNRLRAGIASAVFVLTVAGTGFATETPLPDLNTSEIRESQIDTSEPVGQKTAPKPTPSEQTSKTLETILQKAAQDGLLTLNPDESDADINEAATTSLAQTEPTPSSHNILTADIECTDTQVIDLSSVIDVKTYDDVMVIKSQSLLSDDFKNILPLAQSYLALGLGSEAAALVKNQSGNEAALFRSASHIVDGFPALADLNRVETYKHCNANTALWFLMGQAAFGENQDVETLRASMLNAETQIEFLPEALGTMVQTRLGIHAAEQGLARFSQNFLWRLDPSTRAGNLPRSRSDELLYLYGLVNLEINPEKALPVMQFLSERDGLYKVNALLSVSKHAQKSSDDRKDEFWSDMRAVQNLYYGRKEARSVTLEMIEHYIQTSQLTSAIDLTRAELTLDDAEYMQSIHMVGDRVTAQLRSDKSAARLYAVNAYSYAPTFFAGYSHSATLKALAFDQAVALNMPEVALKISSEDDPSAVISADHKSYARAQVALKNRDYSAALMVAKRHPHDAKFRHIARQASLQLDEAASSDMAMTDDIDATEAATFKARKSWKKGEWTDAKQALETLEKAAPSAQTQKKISVADFILSQEQSPTTSRAVISMDDVNQIRSNTVNDIKAVKDYLEDG